EQVEQDLVLSRLIVEVASHPLLGGELVFRGGTCLHKVWLDRPWRYSEDLDYVRRTAGGVGDILDAIREVATIAGFDRVHTDVRRYPKARLDSTSVRGGRMRVKIELNTLERVSARPIVTKTFDVDSPWFSGSAGPRSASSTTAAPGDSSTSRSHRAGSSTTTTTTPAPTKSSSPGAMC
ncbi:MAG: nucleotidyl transferase AbiEii/AbiGii toxin family protein, partial [Chloroflexota bacterium]|nr:nucleotidyl transferase AbiEii/AbiGii toxin family protein [Chloroflexota bacterium]